MSKVLQKLAQHPWFDRGANIIILFSGILLGLETFPGIYQAGPGWFGLMDRVIMFVFALELGIRFGATGFRPGLFLKNGWNILDFMVVVLPLLPFTGHYQTFARAIRVFRILRLLRLIPELHTLMRSITGSIRYILSISLLLGLVFYAYSVAGVVMFGQNDVLHFRDLSTSILTMFRVVTLEDWTDIMYINMFGCDVYGYELRAHLCTKPEAYPVEAALFFVSFVSLGTMIILNLFIAVIVESIGALKNNPAPETRATPVAEEDIREELDFLTERLQSLREKIHSKKAG